MTARTFNQRFKLTLITLITGLFVAASTFVTREAHGATSFTYDTADRLIASEIDGNITRYRYDALGQLEGRCFTPAGAGAEETCVDFVLDESADNTTVLSETDKAGTTASFYAWGPSGLAAQKKLGTTEYPIVDHLGSIRQMVGADGNGRSLVTAYEAYGSVRATQEPDSRKRPSFGFAGEVTNPDGTIYLRSRHYLPSLGRFLERDAYAGAPERPSSLNRYTYVENNPIGYVDPSGEAKLDYTLTSETLRSFEGQPATHTERWLNESYNTGEGAAISVIHGHSAISGFDGISNSTGSPISDSIVIRAADVSRYASGKNPDVCILVACNSARGTLARDGSLGHDVPVAGARSGFETIPGKNGRPADRPGQPLSDFNDGTGWHDTKFDVYQGGEKVKGMQKKTLPEILDTFNGRGKAFEIDPFTIINLDEAIRRQPKIDKCKPWLPQLLNRLGHALWDIIPKIEPEVTYPIES